MRLVLVLLLSCGLAERQPMNKCRLRDLMIQATTGKPNVLSDGTVRAKIVCAVETVTRFNTSAVSQESREAGQPVWNFYGLFQLPNGLTCSDHAAQVPNICGAKCSDFLDDHINDDLQCLVKSFTSLLQGGFGGENFEGLKTMVIHFLPGQCNNRNGTEYFADCE